MKASLRIIGLTLGFFLIVGFSVPASYAKSSNDFSSQFGLLVHQINQDKLVPRIKALSTLLNYFPNPESKKKVDIKFKDITSGSLPFSSVEKACNLGILDCDEDYFNPDETLSQRDFLDWFFKLKYYKQPTLLKKQYPFLSNDYLRSWLEARRLNLLSDTTITYKVFQDFLYRNTVVEANFGQSFREGLMIDYQEITAVNYHNLSEISLIQKNLQEIIDRLNTQQKLSSEESAYRTKTKRHLKAFNELKLSLQEKPFVLRQYPDLNPEVSRAVREYELQDVLYRYSYDYSHNEAYRKHNLTTGVLKMNGKVFLPGDVIDYWKIISDKNLWDFRYGWVIAQGESKWQFGGGICGSSSMVFLPAWKAGLEILERNNHSQYYSNLYPMENIGLDATVYRPRPNLRIKNNMDSPIVFNVINDKDLQIITVEIIGNQKYKNIRIEGPILETPHYVKWIRHFEDFDGKVTSEVLESRYSLIY